MSEEKKREELYQALFVQLVLSLHSATMQHLGKLPNPLTNKIERNLDQARASIDMLDMIREKTRGNLTDEENRLITRLISECKLNFVDEMAREEKERAAKAEEAKEAAPGAAEGPEKEPVVEEKQEPATEEKHEPVAEEKQEPPTEEKQEPMVEEKQASAAEEQREKAAASSSGASAESAEAEETPKTRKKKSTSKRGG